MSKFRMWIAGGVLALGAMGTSLAEPVPNLPPVANAGGPYLLYLGENLQLDGSGSTDPNLPLDALSYAWDLDDDGAFDDASGMAPIVSWALLFAALHPRVGQSYVLGLRVTDSFGATDTASALISVLERTTPSLPEPSSVALVLLGIGLAGSIARRRRVRP